MSTRITWLNRRTFQSPHLARPKGYQGGGGVRDLRGIMGGGCSTAPRTTRLSGRRNPTETHRVMTVSASCAVILDLSHTQWEGTQNQCTFDYIGARQRWDTCGNLNSSCELSSVCLVWWDKHFIIETHGLGLLKDSLGLKTTQSWLEHNSNSFADHILFTGSASDACNEDVIVRDNYTLSCLKLRNCSYT